MQTEHYKLRYCGWISEVGIYHIVWASQNKERPNIKLDSDICGKIKTKGELEADLNDTDSYLTELEQKIAIVEQYVKNASQPPVTPSKITTTRCPIHPQI